MYSHDQNFQFCNFCKGDTMRKDNLRFSHWLFDKETKELTCPFLKSTICQVCLETGHTANKCANAMRVQELHMAAMMVDQSKDTPAARQARFAYEKEIDRRIMVQAYINMDKNCTFCAGGNYKDGFHKTHILSKCPRLACSMCTYCGSKGHTKTKCESRINDELWNTSDPNITEFIIDFDNDAMDMTT